MSEISTAFSDLVLASICMHSIYFLQHHSSRSWFSKLSSLGLDNSLIYLYATTGLLLILIAASLGVLKFGLSSPPHNLVRTHSWFSWLAATVAIPLVAVEYHFILSPVRETASILLVVTVITVLLWRFFGDRTQEALNKGLNGIALISIGTLCFLYNTSWHPIIGAVLVCIAGLVFGDSGESLLGLPAVDWFHYILAGAVFMLAQGLK